MKDTFTSVIQILLGQWYIMVPLIVILICSLYAKIDERKYYKSLKKEITNKEAVKKIRKKVGVKIFVVCMAVLIIFVTFYFSNEIIYETIYLNINNILKYIIIYCIVVSIIIAIMLKKIDADELIKEQLKDAYNCEETSEGFMVSLDKGYIGILKYEKEAPFIKTSIKCVTEHRIRRRSFIRYEHEVNVTFEVFKNNQKTCNYKIVLPIIKRKIEEEDIYYNREIEKIMMGNMDLMINLKMTYDRVYISTFKKINQEIKFENKYRVFFYMLETAIKMANIIINDENS